MRVLLSLPGVWVDVLSQKIIQVVTKLKVERQDRCFHGLNGEKMVQAFHLLFRV